MLSRFLPLRNRFDLAALLLGVALPYGFAPLSWYPLAVLIPAALFWLWQDLTPRQAFRSGYLFGAGMFGMGVWWVFVAIHDFGDTSAALSTLLTAIFVGVLALLPALQASLSAYCRKYLPHNRWQLWLIYLWIFPLNWVLFEWLRGWLFTGFPWLNLGYSQIDSPLAGYAPLLGVYGVSLLTVFSAGLLVMSFIIKHSTRWFAPVLLLLLWLGGFGLSRTEWTHPVDEPLAVAIVQGNQDQLTKWNSDKIRAQMQAYADLSEPYWDKADLIIWPENALTILYPVDVPEDFKQLLQDRTRQNQTDLILGVPYGDYQIYHSSLLVIGEHDGVYHKRHLVPFGEYVPLQTLLRGLIGFFDLPMSSFTPGERQQPLLVAAGQPMAPSICYEDAFGEELIDFLPQATLLVNGSNNAWYGHSWAAYQHLQIARMRAVETGRMLMRATTNGISAVVDHHGKITAHSPQFVSDVITAEVQPRAGATPYVQLGNWPMLILFVLSVIAMLLLPRVTHAEFDLADLH